MYWLWIQGIEEIMCRIVAGYVNGPSTEFVAEYVEHP